MGIQGLYKTEKSWSGFHDALKIYGPPKLCTVMQQNDQFSAFRGAQRNDLQLHLILVLYGLVNKLFSIFKVSAKLQTIERDLERQQGALLLLPISQWHTAISLVQYFVIFLKFFFIFSSLFTRLSSIKGTHTQISEILEFRTQPCSKKYVLRRKDKFVNNL